MRLETWAERFGIAGASGRTREHHLRVKCVPAKRFSTSSTIMQSTLEKILRSRVSNADLDRASSDGHCP